MSLHHKPKLGRPLSPSEARVFELLTAGKSMKAAARLMGVAANTTQTHAARARVKLGARSNEQAAVLFDRARREGF